MTPRPASAHVFDHSKPPWRDVTAVAERSLGALECNQEPVKLSPVNHEPRPDWCTPRRPA
jgi:hypothetical protein